MYSSWEVRILLCRRAIDPRLGLWTFPAGFMEIGETTEEALAVATILSRYAVLSMPNIGQGYMVVRGRMLAPTFDVGAESLDVDLCKREDTPWDKMVFSLVAEALRFYVRDAQTGQFPLRLGTVLECYPS